MRNYKDTEKKVLRQREKTYYYRETFIKIF